MRARRKHYRRGTKHSCSMENSALACDGNIVPSKASQEVLFGDRNPDARQLPVWRPALRDLGLMTKWK